MLGEKLREHGSHVWLVNTCWSGGAYGTGKRMKLGYTRAMVRAALAGALDKVSMETDTVFGLSVPTEVPDVPITVLRTRETWPDRDAYDAQARKLAEMFRKNFEKFGSVAENIRGAGPKG